MEYNKEDIQLILEEAKYEKRRDKEENVMTRQCIRLHNISGNYDYVPTPYRMLDSLFGKFPFSKDEIFLDIGCGLGRVLFTAASYGCTAVYGVEINLNIYSQLLLNLERHSLKNNIHIFCDTAENVIGKIVNADRYFFFNPFDLAGFRNIISTIISIRKSCLLCFYAPFEETLRYIATLENVTLITVLGNGIHENLKLYVYKFAAEE